MHMMEPVTFERDTEGVLIPDGYTITALAGTRGHITQVLGRHWTVQLDTGRLVRVSADDGVHLDTEDQRALGVAVGKVVEAML